MNCVARNHRGHTPVFWGTGLGAVLLLSSLGSAMAGTIDFESPALGSENQLSTNVYQDQGVTITASTFGLLMKESAYYPCPDLTAGNQAFVASGWVYGCLCCYALIRIDFPPAPADPVFRVAAEVRAGPEVLRLELYDANDTLLGESVQAPPRVSCNLPTRGTLEATAARPVAYAIIWNRVTAAPGPIDCLASVEGEVLPGSDLGPEPCCVYGPIVVIDNLSFDGGAVPVRPTSWGTVKMLYR